MNQHPDAALSIANWLLAEGRDLELPALIEGTGIRLAAAGVPIDRFSISFGILNPSVLAVGVRWRPGQATEVSRYEYARRDDGLYERSPFKVANEENRWLEIDINNTSDERFGIIPDLRAEGIAHYLVIPLPKAMAGIMTLTVATKDVAGYSKAHHAILAGILPAFGAVCEVNTLRSTFRTVLGAYVGSASAHEILKGTVHRGEVTPIKAAIFIADLRGFTHLSTQLPPAQTAELVNRYYDAVVPKVHAHGGQVLKFIGDAVLGVFPAAECGDATQATLGALNAARDALKENCAPFQLNGHSVEIRFGIAIHMGLAVLGNVGSQERLDFTVIGRDVNIAARIGSLCSLLGHDFLVSEEVAKIGKSDGMLMSSAGSHTVRGLENPLTVYVPDVKKCPPASYDGVSQGLTLVD